MMVIESLPPEQVWVVMVDNKPRDVRDDIDKAMSAAARARLNLGPSAHMTRVEVVGYLLAREAVVLTS